MFKDTLQEITASVIEARTKAEAEAEAKAKAELERELQEERLAVLERVMDECRIASHRGERSVGFPSVKILPRMVKLIEKHAQYIRAETGLTYQVSPATITFYW